MSRMNEREIARKLAEREELEPPAGLLEKIKSEIPPSIPIGTETPEVEMRSPVAPRQRWLMAASVVAMIGAGLLALQVRMQMAPVAQETAHSESAAQSVPQRKDQAPEAPPSGPPPAERMSPSGEAEPLLDAGQAVPPPPPAPPPSPKPLSRQADELKSLGYITSQAEGGVEGGVPGGAVGGEVGGVEGNAPAPSRAVPPAAVAKPKDEPTTAAEPLLTDERRLERADTISQADLEKIPTARNPQAPLQSTLITLAESAGAFKSAGTSPFTDTATDRLSTFGLDVDTASYTVARRYLVDGRLPVPASVRVEEFVNFFDYGDPTPRQGDFAIKAEGASTPFVQGPQYRLLRFNLRGREVRMDNRRPVVLTFVIDVSGSMAAENRLGLVKQSLSLLLDQLRPTDRIGLVVFGDTARVLQEPSGDREAVRRAIELLVPEGSTNTEEGLKVGYEVAGRSFRPSAANRIILCSDGVANVGHAGPQAILGQIGRAARGGIELTTLGFGMGSYNDHLMEQLADKGDGRYAYIDTLAEAKRVLVEELSGTLLTIAKDAKAQVEFNPAVVARYRQIGYENRAIADERFRDNRVIAGQVGAGHSVTALYEIELRPGAPRDGLVATLHLRYRSPEVGNLTEMERKLYLSGLAPSWGAASPGFRLAALVAQFAEILKGSPWARADLAEVARQVRDAQKGLPKSAKTSELADLVEKAARIKGAGQE
jgi:Ca-activated chloride channel homolog